MSLTDLTSTIAAITQTALPHDAAEDSFNLLPAWLDPNHPQIRPYLLTQAFGGLRTLAIRKGDWKYIDHVGSGGNRYDSDPSLRRFDIPDNCPNANGQLYHLASDPGEKKNQFETYPERVAELKALLEETKASGRSR
jgi:arylsulfatase A-like enzyme